MPDRPSAKRVKISSDDRIISVDDTGNQLRILSNALVYSEEDLKSLVSHVASKAPHKITMWGKVHDMPRRQAFMCDVVSVPGYKFSGQIVRSEPVHALVQLALDKASELYPEYTWNAALVNYYEDGNNYISQHSDDETDHSRGAPILAFSFGAVRDFVVRRKSDKTKKIVALEHNSICVMEGATFQQDFTHELLKCKRVKTYRLSITIRSFA